MGEIPSAGPATIHSRPPNWSFGLAFPFCCWCCCILRQKIKKRPWHQSGTRSQILHAWFKLLVWLKVISNFFPPLVQLFLHQLRGKETNTAPKYFHYTQHPDTRGRGSLSAQKVKMFRLRPWGTRVRLSLKPRPMTGSSPRCRTGRPVPSTWRPSPSLLPPQSWTAQMNWSATRKLSVSKNCKFIV